MVSPESTLMYFIPGFTTTVRAAIDAGAGEPNNNAVLFIFDGGADGLCRTCSIQLSPPSPRNLSEAHAAELAAKRTASMSEASPLRFIVFSWSVKWCERF